jgi:hypothetical protein
LSPGHDWQTIIATAGVPPAMTVDGLIPAVASLSSP